MIGIKDLEMPKCCALCNFYYMYKNNLDLTSIYDESLSFRCMADMKLKRMARKDFLKHRHITCPLIEIKESEEE